MAFDEARLLRVVQSLPTPAVYTVAFSGGLDSSVLLHAMAGLRPVLDAPLAAIHVDHDLQPASADWRGHCAAVCAALGVPLVALRIRVDGAAGLGLEAAARNARYAALAGQLPPGGMLLTAHHLDDQVETMLLQLLRGAGPAGLAGMPACRSWSDGWHARPLLAARREELHAYATAAGLEWVEDPSNAGRGPDRNYLRHAVLPRIAARWPGHRETLGRSAAHCAEAAHGLDAMATGDLAAITGTDAPSRLDLARFSALAAYRRKGVLRAWLRALDAPALDSRRLELVLSQVVAARPDATPLLEWHDCQLRRFRGELWFLRAAPRPQEPLPQLAWEGAMAELPAGLGTLRRHLGPGGIPDARWAAARIAWPAPGLRCAPAGRQGSRNMKKLGQEYAIPPWVRPNVPLLLLGGEVAAIGDYCLCEPFAGGGGEGWLLDWDSPPGWR